MRFLPIDMLCSSCVERNDMTVYIIIYDKNRFIWLQICEF